MIVSVNQPAYLPWLGYFDRIAKSDLHIVLDHVQFEKGSFTNRTRIRQRDGRLVWLTVPVEKGKPINQTWATSEHWIGKHRRALTQTYGADAAAIVPDHMRLDHICRHATLQLLHQVGLGDAQLVRSQDLSARGTKSGLVLSLCQEVGATQYLSGPLGRNYLYLSTFEKAGIEVLWHDYQDPDDPPLSAVHHLFSGSTTVWPLAHPTSQASSPLSTVGQEGHHPAPAAAAAPHRV